MDGESNSSAKSAIEHIQLALKDMEHTATELFTSTTQLMTLQNANTEKEAKIQSLIAETNALQKRVAIQDKIIGDKLNRLMFVREEMDIIVKKRPAPDVVYVMLVSTLKRLNDSK